MAKISGKKGSVEDLKKAGRPLFKAVAEFQKDDWQTRARSLHSSIENPFDAAFKRRINELNKEMNGSIEFGFPKKIIGLKEYLDPSAVKAEMKEISEGEWILPKWEGEMALKSSDTPFLRMLDANKYEDIAIRKVNNGWIVNVGCEPFVETSWARISKALELYFRDPEAAKKKYLKKK